jgi:hypothetical protein
MLRNEGFKNYDEVSVLLLYPWVLRPEACMSTVWNQDRYLGLEAILKGKG